MKNHPRRTVVLAAVLLSMSIPAPADSVARTWNEQNLAAVRLSFPDPPVHARNLFHVSVAMYDAWAAYEWLETHAARLPEKTTYS